MPRVRTPSVSIRAQSALHCSRLNTWHRLRLHRHHQHHLLPPPRHYRLFHLKIKSQLQSLRESSGDVNAMIVTVEHRLLGGIQSLLAAAGDLLADFELCHSKERVLDGSYHNHHHHNGTK